MALASVVCTMSGESAFKTTGEPKEPPTRAASSALWATTHSGTEIPRFSNNTKDVSASSQWSPSSSSKTVLGFLGQGNSAQKRVLSMP